MTGPYVVRHLPACTCDGIHADASCPRWADDRGAVFLQAFETLEEARAEASRLVRKAGRQWSEELAEPHAAAHSLPAEGGKVELPDGSEIVVEATTIGALFEATPIQHRVMYKPGQAPDDATYSVQILAPFNAAMAERYGTEAAR